MAQEKNVSKIFELLSRAEEGTDVTIRDDQGDFAAFLDAAKVCRANGGRFRLIDTRRLGVFELEWLAEAGADIYTSDEARPNPAEIGLLARACSRGDAIVAYYHHGPLIKNKEGDPASLSFLLGIGQGGSHVHLSNRDTERRPSDLSEVAYACRRAGAGLVYYHHGRPMAELEEVARSGAWIHASDQGLESRSDTILLVDLIKEASAAGAGLVLHVERGFELARLRDYFRAGAFILFASLPADHTSSLRSLECQAGRRKLDFRAYYLYSTLWP